MREYSTMPEPASSAEKPPGAGRMASSSELLPVNTSCSVIFGARSSITSRLARPRSASSTSTRRPCRASAAARLTLTKVLPTPPLPLVTAVMRARAAAAVSCRRCSRGDIRLLGTARRCAHSMILKLRDSEQQRLFLGTDHRHRRRLEAHAVAPLGLGAVELDVGALDPQRRRRAHPLRRKGAADADADMDLLRQRRCSPAWPRRGDAPVRPPPHRKWPGSWA